MSVTERPQVGDGKAARRRLGVLDCDIHNALRSRDTLKSYLPDRWHVYYDRLHPAGRVQLGARPQPDFFRRDAFPAQGAAGSDLGLMREQYLDPFNVRAGVLSPLDPLTWPTAGDLSLALNSALNDWIVEEWLTRDDRLYAAISVPLEDGLRAAEEIERAAADPRFVMVLLLVTSREPLGNPKYWPIYEAAVANKLPVGVHVAGFSGTATATGYPAYHAESHLTMVTPYTAQTASLVYSGVFERWPSLQFVLEEGGIGWVPPLMWRMDRAWEAMREEHPHLQTRPSETIRNHFYFTTQPLDEPEKDEYLPQLLDHLGMDDRILFASDYPHWDFDNPDRVLTESVVGAERREKILARNALAVMRFPEGA
jgi:predicted TIM-barrel fold metal-dependent hydrolase